MPTRLAALAALRVAYSVSEAAAQLGVSHASIWRALKRRQLESIKLGGRRLVTARSLEKLLSGKERP